MSEHQKISRDDIKFKTVKFFVCACSQCGNKQEIFADEINQTHTCNQCAGKINFDECSYEVP